MIKDLIFSLYDAEISWATGNTEEFINHRIYLLEKIDDLTSGEESVLSFYFSYWLEDIMLALCLGSRSAKYIKIPNRILNRRVKRTPLLLGCLEETNGSRELKFNPFNAISSQSEDEIFDIINEQFSHKLGALKIIEAFIAESEVDLDTLDTIKDAGYADILCQKANTSRDNDKVVKKNIERY